MLRRVSVLIVLLFCSAGILRAQSESGAANSEPGNGGGSASSQGAEKGSQGPIEVDIVDLQPTPVGVSIALRAPDSEQTLYMMVGSAEGQAIARALGHETTSRPMTHDLLKEVLDRNGWKVEKVLIREFRDDSFQADLVVTKGDETQTYDCRPSDAMAVGLLYGAKIYVNPQVFKQEPGGAEQQPSTSEPSGSDSLKL